ncbi:MAG: serine hydrolase, partial [Defluviitaleaceae bacterium]|nr:serine hydrolase [Defluviitaleaceae bacterium]
MKKCISLILLAAIFAVFAPSFTAYAAATPSGIPFSDWENQIDDFMAQHIGNSTPGAAVVIVHEGEIIFSKGYGYADT